MRRGGTEALPGERGRESERARESASERCFVIDTGVFIIVMFWSTFVTMQNNEHKVLEICLMSLFHCMVSARLYSLLVVPLSRGRIHSDATWNCPDTIFNAIQKRRHRETRNLPAFLHLLTNCNIHGTLTAKLSTSLPTGYARHVTVTSRYRLCSARTLSLAHTHKHKHTHTLWTIVRFSEQTKKIHSAYLVIPVWIGAGGDHCCRIF